MKGSGDYLVAFFITLSLHFIGAAGYQLLSPAARESMPRPETAEEQPLKILFSLPRQSPPPAALPPVLPVENIAGPVENEAAEPPAPTPAAAPVETGTAPAEESQEPPAGPITGPDPEVPRYYKPELINEIQPRYPLAARRRQQEGVVQIEAWIKISGRVDRLEILISSGHPALDRAALKAAKKARFKPAEIDGRIIEGSVTISIRFQIDN